MTLTLVGFGLLASSIAAVIRQSGADIRIQAVSSQASAQKAVDSGLAHVAFSYDQIEQWLCSSDVVILCSPVNHIVQILEQIKGLAHLLKHPVLISDIGSTKSKICKVGFSLPPPLIFVGGHPMAGSEKRGLEFHDPSLFENAYWILCPQSNVMAEQYAELSQIIEMTGAHPVVLDAQDHDRIMARLSHVPQLLSTTLAASLSQNILDQGHQHLAGRGFRDMTRLAASPWPMWKDIVQSNKQEIHQGLLELRQTLDQMIAGIEQNNESKNIVESLFARGGFVRSSLSNAGKGFSHSLHEVFVQIPDQAGTILAVVAPLSAANINILDIELAKVREGVGGTLLLGFKHLHEAEQCVNLLQQKGFEARVRS